MLFVLRINILVQRVLFKKIPPLDCLYSMLSGGSNRQPAASLVLKIKTFSAHILSIQRIGLVHPINLGTLPVPPPTSFLDTKMNDLQARLLQW